ncbi:MAG: hypothetical protein ACJ8G7_15615 [Rhizobacter sp.]
MKTLIATAAAAAAAALTGCAAHLPDEPHHRLEVHQAAGYEQDWDWAWGTYTTERDWERRGPRR